ncbi:trihelix transcription factor ASIL2-like [Triticum urartu]|uniref:trihelix transcription factor ASIL2-like n=1 Tax=Triticum urartu TaxID=4572 RepID=UPI00204328A0|nr:trihelix transcription factor ASIL2-like [Triticum urartu]
MRYKVHYLSKNVVKPIYPHKTSSFLPSPQFTSILSSTFNSRRGATARRRRPRTDIQCKNRVDTLKKKYKAERARGGPSAWNFYGELDRLVGPTLSASAATKKHPSFGLPAPHFALPLHPSAARRHPSPSSSPSPPPPMALPLSNYRHRAPLLATAFIQQAATAAAAISDSDDSSDLGDNNNNNSHQSPSHFVSSHSGGNNKRRRSSESSGGGDGGVGELARAIEAFAEMYERVESAKQKQSLEMERERIAFMKQLEVKRMENFVDAHVKLARMKHAKKNGGYAANGTIGVELASSMAALPFLSNPAYL